MCRVAVRQAPRNRPEEVKQEQSCSLLYDQLQGYTAQPSGLQLRLQEDDIDFDNLFEDEEAGLETGELDLLALFSEDALPAQTPQQQKPCAAYAAAAAVPGVPAPAAAADPAVQAVQQLQLQAIMQQQLAQQQQQQQYAAASVAGPAALSQDIAQLQQYQAAQVQAMLAAQASLRSGHPVNKRGKTQAEVEEQQERIKKRRRESAQRSRARKNSYMKTLEVENKALKMENERLRMELMKLSGKAGSTSSSKPDTPSQHMVLMSEHQDQSGDFSDDELCNDEMCNDKSGLSMPVPSNFFPLVL